MPYELQYDSIERFRFLLDKKIFGSTVRVTLSKTTSVELLKSNIKLEKEVYLITTVDEEADTVGIDSYPNTVRLNRVGLMSIGVDLSLKYLVSCRLIGCKYLASCPNHSVLYIFIVTIH